MTAAFDRRLVRVGIEIEGQTEYFEDLRIYATGTKWRCAMMSQCEIRIFNLTREHQQYILTKASPIVRPPAQLTPIKVTLDVGRESYGTFRLFEGQCFQGGVSQPPDIGIILSSLTNNFLLASTQAISLGQFATLKDIVNTVATSIGCTPRLISDNPDRYIGNYSFTGSPQKQVDKLNQMGVIAYVDNNVLIVTDPEKARNSTPIMVNNSTGMVGIPQPTMNGCMLRVMVNNEIQVGSLIQIESVENPAVNGQYIVWQLNFEVSNRDEMFWYDMECVNVALYQGALT